MGQFQLVQRLRLHQVRLLFQLGSQNVQQWLSSTKQLCALFPLGFRLETSQRSVEGVDIATIGAGIAHKWKHFSTLVVVSFIQGFYLINNNSVLRDTTYNVFIFHDISDRYTLSVTATDGGSLLRSYWTDSHIHDRRNHRHCGPV